jgi:hypothetical protein
VSLKAIECKSGYVTKSTLARTRLHLCDSIDYYFVGGGWGGGGGGKDIIVACGLMVLVY